MTESLPGSPQESLRSDLANAGVAAPSRPSGAATATALNIWIQRYKDMAAKAREFEDRNAELEALYELQQTRMAEAIALWREANPGNENVLPDLGRLLEWMLSEMRRAEDMERASSCANCGGYHSLVDGCSAEFFEDDEPIEVIEAILERPADGVTGQ